MTVRFTPAALFRTIKNKKVAAAMDAALGDPNGEHAKNALETAHVALSHTEWTKNQALSIIGRCIAPTMHPAGKAVLLTLRQAANTGSLDRNDEVSSLYVAEHKVQDLMATGTDEDRVRGERALEACKKLTAANLSEVHLRHLWARVR